MAGQHRIDRRPRSFPAPAPKGQIFPESSSLVWLASQAGRANVLLDSPGVSAVIVATNGTMARINPVHPATFIAFNWWLAGQAGRDALKRYREILQADSVQELLERYLPQV